MKARWMWFFMLFLSHSVVAFEDPLDDEFDELDAQLEQAFEQQDEQLERAFQLVKKAVDDAYQGLTKKIQVDWGADVVLPDKHQWTTYSEDFKTRASFDFEQGVYRIETLVEGDLAKSLLQLQHFGQEIAKSDAKDLQQKDVLLEQVQKEIEQQQNARPQFKALTVSARFDSSSHLDSKLVLPLDTDNLIAGLVKDELQRIEAPALPPKAPIIVSEETVEPTPSSQPKKLTTEPQPIVAVEQPSMPVPDKAQLADVSHASESAAQGLSLQKSVEGKLNKLVLTIPFINDYQKTLIETRLETVRRLSREYNVDASLIMAVIETESSFNPMATSPIPAFGLMQLVPSTGAVDAYHFLYGEKKVVSPDFLYDQDNNLTMGTVYLHLLNERYLGRIEDPMSRLYCAVASYNIGLGNLAKTFTGSKGLGKATVKINTMDAEETYDFLQSRLPAEETRNYLKKVLARKQKYAYLDSF